MIKEFSIQEDAFLEKLKSLYENLILKNDLTDVRKKAFEQFLTLGLPDRRQERFRYLPLRKLFEKEWTNPKTSHSSQDEILKSIFPECKTSYLVFVNGQYKKELSNVTGLSSKIVISHLKEAFNSYSSFLNQHFSKTVKEEKDPFVCLNLSLQEEALFIYVPPKIIQEQPIQILNLIDSEDSILVNPRMQLFAGAFSNLKIVYSEKILSGTGHLVNMVADFVLDDDATINYTKVLTDRKETDLYFDATRAKLKKRSAFHTHSVTNGSLISRSDYKITLTGEHGLSSLNGLSMLDEANEFHAHVLMHHEAPFCESRQLFKYALNDFSKSSFEGKILVDQEAQKTDAFQLNSNLLLSDHVNANSKPNLEIFADDVKASHGSTFGQLNQEELFFLKSRGINAKDAKNLLIFGFCKEIIDLIPVQSVKDFFESKAKAYKS